MDIRKNLAHESAAYHVTGKAIYIDDKTVPNILHGLVYSSPHAHAKILSFNLTEARKTAGVYAVLSYKDILGINNMGPVVKDEPILAEDEINFVGQGIFLIAAENPEIGLEAMEKIKVEFDIMDPVFTLEQAMKQGRLLNAPRLIRRGDVEKGLKQAKHVIEGELITGAQEHWYLETQVSLCLPGEGTEMKVYSSTQHPSETQALIAKALGISKAEIEVEVRRMGGAFGGKETQANHVAIWSALLARATGRPVKIRLSRDDDQKMTGKRHPFLIRYKAGFNDEGVITAVKIEQNANAGSSTDLTMAVLGRAMMHADNSYYIPNIYIEGKAWMTNLPSNTAFRGFGGPQGMAGMETVIDRVARFLKIDAINVRFNNFYGIGERDDTPYDQKVENNRLFTLFEKLVSTAKYWSRRQTIIEFNASDSYYKKGMALTPVKFGISFTTSFLNQAGALVSIYKDGTVLANQGGTEMGQGLYTKIRQIVALELGISLDQIRVNSTDTAKVPNTSATAASAGTDLNGMAVKNAIEKLKKRIAKSTAKHFSNSFKGLPSEAEDICFANVRVYDRKFPEREISFKEAVRECYENQGSLSATGFYKTPDLYFSEEKGKGKPFHYFVFGMAVTEVLLDTLTGYSKILSVDILHDVGDSINPRMDVGQIEGGYMQGVGWCTTEECKWDEKGNLLNHSPDTYKIPSIQDMPEIFNTELLQGVPNPNTIRKSKAVGEPPLMLALSCWLAIKDAISAVGNHQYEPEFSLPATNEVILLSLEKVKREMLRETAQKNKEQITI